MRKQKWWPSRSSGWEQIQEQRRHKHRHLKWLRGAAPWDFLTSKQMPVPAPLGLPTYSFGNSHTPSPLCLYIVTLHTSINFCLHLNDPSLIKTWRMNSECQLPHYFAPGPFSNLIPSQPLSTCTFWEMYMSSLSFDFHPSNGRTIELCEYTGIMHVDLLALRLPL